MFGPGGKGRRVAHARVWPRLSCSVCLELCSVRCAMSRMSFRRRGGGRSRAHDDTARVPLPGNLCSRPRRTRRNACPTGRSPSRMAPLPRATTTTHPSTPGPRTGPGSPQGVAHPHGTRVHPCTEGIRTAVPRLVAFRPGGSDSSPSSHTPPTPGASLGTSTRRSHRRRPRSRTGLSISSNLPMYPSTVSHHRLLGHRGGCRLLGHQKIRFGLRYNLGRQETWRGNGKLRSRGRQRSITLELRGSTEDHQGMCGLQDFWIQRHIAKKFLD